MSCRDYCTAQKNWACCLKVAFVVIQLCDGDKEPLHVGLDAHLTQHALKHDTNASCTPTDNQSAKSFTTRSDTL